MTDKRSQNKTIPFDLKKGGALVIILALLILAANAILSDRGTPLPTDVVNLAETVVGDSLASDQTGTATVPSTRTPKSPTPTPKAPSTSTPVSAPSGSGDLAWAGAEGKFDYYVLALSWQPAFCETQPTKEECETQAAGRFDATNFALHGLWPNITGDDDHTYGYCDVTQGVIEQDKAGDWCDMPQLSLSDTVWQDLTVSMPGTASCLENHEWYKHSVCAGMSPEAYFALTNALVTRFAETNFNHYVAERIGNDVARRDLLSQFDAEFGDGASDFLSLRCTKLNGISLLTEIQIVLQPDLTTLDDFAALFPDEQIPPAGNCPQTFRVDQVGLRNY
jgi:ribonuclease I